MSNNTSPLQDKDSLLAVGRQCSASSCMLVDFLPFTCQHCQKPFCGEHFLPAGHSCPDYDPTIHNRVAPSCPLCKEIVAIPPGQDPNIRMEQHISTQCSVMTGKSGKAKSGPVCAKGRCGKVLFAPIRCQNCKEQFCPQHRFPKDHSCTVSAPAPPPASSGGMSAVKANALAKFNSRFNPKPSIAAKPALPKPVTKPSTAAPSNTTTNKSTSEPSTSSSPLSNLPFSSTNRDSRSPPPTSTHTDAHTNPIDPPSTDTDSPNASSHKPPAIDPMAFVPRSVFARA